MEDVSDKEARYGQRGAVGFKRPLVEKTYHFIGFDHEAAAVYYRFRNQVYRCTSYLGSLQHEHVDEETVASISSNQARWTAIHDRRAYTQAEALNIIQQHLGKDLADSTPPPKKGWFRTLMEVLLG